MSLQQKSLFMAMELSNKNWKLAFGDGSRERICTVPAGAEKALLNQMEQARAKFRLAGDAPVISC